MIIDWDCKAAEGCDWALLNAEIGMIHFYNYRPSNNGISWNCKGVSGEPSYKHYTLHERPKAEQMKETFYTKEMHERGEVVGTGMTATYKDKEVIIRLGCDTLRNVVFRLDGEWVIVNVDYIKPIDTRTEKEKAIDDLSIVIENYNKSSVELKSGFSLAEWLLNDVNDNLIHGITFTGDK